MVTGDLIPADGAELLDALLGVGQLGALLEDRLEAGNLLQAAAGT